MPHDANGELIKVGDTVYLPCTVKAITSSGNEYCNIAVDLNIPMPPYSDHMSLHALNARQTLKDPSNITYTIHQEKDAIKKG